MTRKLDDWIERYLEFTQNTESPRIYHAWTALSALASCLQRKCWLSWGFETIYPNLYVVLVGPPGGRKGTAMKILKPFLQDLGIIMSADSVGSVQSLYNEIKDSLNSFKHPDGNMTEHRSLTTWSEEFQVFLGDNDPKLIMAITDLFDSPSKWEYKSIKRGTDDLSNCWFNLLGAITPTLLQGRLSRDAQGGGLLSRIIFIVGYGREKLVPLGFLSEEELKLKTLLQADLERIYQLAGPFTPTKEFAQHYSDWYGTTGGNSHLDNQKFTGYDSRRPLHIRKLCMILSAAESDSMLLRSHHLDKALEILKYTEQYMPDAFYGVGRGYHGDTLADIIAVVKNAKTIDWKTLVKKFQLDMLPAELENCMNSLEQSGLVKKENRMSGGIIYTYQEEKEKNKISLDNTLFKHIK